MEKLQHIKAPLFSSKNHEHIVICQGISFLDVSFLASDGKYI